jgi:hypothetical protein
VVGGDDFRWYTTTPGVPDVPAKDITLTGQNFETSNLLTAEPKDNTTTGAFVPLLLQHRQAKLSKVNSNVIPVF